MPKVWLLFRAWFASGPHSIMQVQWIFIIEFGSLLDVLWSSSASHRDRTWTPSQCTIAITFLCSYVLFWSPKLRRILSLKIYHNPCAPCDSRQSNFSVRFLEDDSSVIGSPKWIKREVKRGCNERIDELIDLCRHVWRAYSILTTTSYMPPRNVSVRVWILLKFEFGPDPYEEASSPDARDSRSYILLCRLDQKGKTPPSTTFALPLGAPIS